MLGDSAYGSSVLYLIKRSELNRTNQVSRKSTYYVRFFKTSACSVVVGKANAHEEADKLYVRFCAECSVSA